MLHTVEDTAERHRVHGSPLFTRQLGQRHDGAKAGAVDHDVQRPEGFACRAHRGFDLLLVRHVGHAADGTLAKLAGDGLESLRIDITQQDVRPGFDECRRDCLADPGCAAGHDGAFAFEYLHLSPLRKCPRLTAVRRTEGRARRAAVAVRREHASSRRATSRSRRSPDRRRVPAGMM
jgi:hypothetical protein